MAGSAHTVGKFGIVFSARGNAIAYVMRLNTEVGVLSRNIRALQSGPIFRGSGVLPSKATGARGGGAQAGATMLSGQMRKNSVLNSAFGQIGMVMGVAYGWVSAARQFVQAGQAMIGVAGGIANAMIGMVTTVGQVRAEFELLEKGFEFVFQEESAKVWEQAMKVAAGTMMKTKDVLNLTRIIGLQGVTDPFAMVKSKTGDMITGIEALSDLAATLGPMGATNIRMSIPEFLSGGPNAIRSVRTRLNLPGYMIPDLERIQKEFIKTGDIQRGYYEFVSLIGQTYGGQGKAMEGTVSFMIAQLEDLWELAADTLGKLAFEIFEPLIKRIYEFAYALTFALREGKYQGLVTAFGHMAAMLEKVAAFAFDVIEAIIKFGEDVPIFWDLVLAVATLAGILSFLGGVALIVFGTISTIFATFAGAIFIVSTLVGAWQAVLGVILAVVVAMGEFAVVGALLTGAFTRNWGGFADMIENVFWMLKGLFELISTNEGQVGSMRTDTAAELAKRGMLEPTLAVFEMFVRMKEMATGIGEGFMAMVPTMEKPFDAMFQRITDTMGTEAAAWMAPLSKMFGDDMGEAKTMGHVIGIAIGMIITLLGYILLAIVEVGIRIYMLVFKPLQVIFQALASVLPKIAMGDASWGDVFTAGVIMATAGPRGLVAAAAGPPPPESKGRRMSDELETGDKTVGGGYTPVSVAVTPGSREAIINRAHLRAKETAEGIKERNYRPIVIKVNLGGDRLLEAIAKLQEREGERAAGDVMYNVGAGGTVEIS